MRILEESELRDQLFGAGVEGELSEKLAELLRSTFRTERTLCLEGVGNFTLRDDGQVEFSPWLRKRVFLAYAVEDRTRVRAICRHLRRHGFDPWMDVERLMPGQNWLESIERAIESADYFVPCFSRVAASKRSYFQAELRHALQSATRHPLDDVFVVPLRLEDCQVPKLIQQVTQYVDLFPDWEDGMERLMATLRARVETPGSR